MSGASLPPDHLSDLDVAISLVEKARLDDHDDLGRLARQVVRLAEVYRVKSARLVSAVRADDVGLLNDRMDAVGEKMLTAHRIVEDHASALERMSAKDDVHRTARTLSRLESVAAAAKFEDDLEQALAEHRGERALAGSP